MECFGFRLWAILDCIVRIPKRLLGVLVRFLSIGLIIRFLTIRLVIRFLTIGLVIRFLTIRLISRFLPIRLTGSVYIMRITCYLKSILCNFIYMLINVLFD